MSSSSKKKKKKVKLKSKQNKTKNVSTRTKSKKKKNSTHENEIKSKKQRQKILEIRRIQSRLLLPTITDQKETTQEANKPCIICGPSGVGKRTILTKIEKSFPNTFDIREQETDQIDAMLVDINRIKAQNLIPLLTLTDVEVANTIKTSKQLNAHYIFITCEGGLATLRQRTKQRNTQTDDEINQQLENAE
eukprot:30124_1